VDRHEGSGDDLQGFFESAPIGMAQVDAEGMLGPVNAAFASLLGLEPDPGLARSLREVVPVIETASRDILWPESGTTRILRRVLTLDTPTGRRSVEVIGWPSRRGATPVACLVLIEDPLGSAVSALTEAVERARAAREIHDGLAQDLWLAKLAVAGLDANPSLDDKARAHCTDLRRAIEAALGETRTAVMAMRSVDVPTPPFVDLLRRHVHEFSDRFGIRVECDLDDTQALQPRVAVEMLRVAQEALNNVHKHARPGRALVRLKEQRGSIVLSVRDDGVGFDPAIGSGGYGRQSMHERALSIGGRLTIASSPGRGTSVTLRVPAGQAGRRG
jgi:signal transduction histidine kinase